MNLLRTIHNIAALSGGGSRQYLLSTGWAWQFFPRKVCLCRLWEALVPCASCGDFGGCS